MFPLRFLFIVALSLHYPFTEAFMAPMTKLFLLAVLPLFLLCLCCCGCIDRERQALLHIRAALEQHSSHPSPYPSWEKGTSCCDWDGIECSNTTHHVVNVLLPVFIDYEERLVEGGIIWQSLCNLTFVEIIDLSYNGISGTLHPCLGNLSFLRELDLVSNSLGGKIPDTLGALSSLTYLHLSDNHLSGNIPDTLGGLSSLTYLHLSDNHLSGNIPDTLGDLISLEYLDLSDNQLNGTLPYSFSRLSSLAHLNAEGNAFNQSIASSALPSSLGFLRLTLDGHQIISEAFFHNLSKLEDLSLSNCELNISITWIPSFQLSSLFLTSCKIEGQIPSWIWTQFSLTQLQLAGSNLVGNIPDSLGDLISLEYLDLSNNQLNGTLPYSFSRLSSLAYLNAEGNAFNQSIASSALPSSLGFLRLTLDGHQIISEAFFHNLSKLEDLSLSNCELNISITWIPSFQLSSLLLTSCKIEGQIPSWISTQFSLKELELAGNNLVGEIPSWLMDMNLLYLNLTANHLQGRLFLNASALQVLDMSHNALCGQLPTIWLPGLRILLLNDNFLTGNIPPSLQFSSLLGMLNLENNQLKGIVPPSLANCSQLQILNMGDNNLGGVIPYEFGELSNLQSLVMRNNQLDGSFPPSISNCTELYFLDVGQNLLKGHIPKSIGNLSKLKVLGMRKNNFEGGIPAEIGQLKHLQILDLSANHLSGSIPRSIFSLQAMLTEPHQEFSMVQLDTNKNRHSTNKNVTYKNALNMDSKGRDEHYTYIFPNMVSIELSDNQLNGELPSDLGKLKWLRLLNLSMNNLNGSIPNSIIQMIWLETLDLSANHFSGPIPSDLGSLSYLEVLNFSSNNLSGSIPQGGHMVTFNKLSYSRNPFLWGCPLPKKCSWPEFSPAHPPISTSINEEEQSEESVWYEIGVGVSFGAGFAAVVVLIVSRKKWEQKYFEGVDLVLKFFFPWIRNLTL